MTLGRFSPQSTESKFCCGSHDNLNLLCFCVVGFEDSLNLYFSSIDILVKDLYYFEKQLIFNDDKYHRIGRVTPPLLEQGLKFNNSTWKFDFKSHLVRNLTMVNLYVSRVTNYISFDKKSILLKTLPHNSIIAH